MYKVIIVDDEYPIRKGLEQYIDWEKLGFKVVKTLSDGLSALDFLRSNVVDVVITDIDMPIMNGITLVEHIRKENLATECVIISGYQDFDYARRLLKLHVNSYLLKPIDNDAVEEIFSEIFEFLNKEKTFKQSLAADKKTIEAMRANLRQQFFSELFLQKNTLSFAQKKLEQLDIGFSEITDNVFISQVHIDNLQTLLDHEWHYGIDALYDSVINCVSTASADIPLSHFQKGRSTICFVAIIPKTQSSLKEQLKNFTDIFTIAIKKLSEMSSICLNLTYVQGYCTLSEICSNTPSISSPTNISEAKITSTPVVSDTTIHHQLTYIYNAINSSFIERDLTDVFERVDLLYSKIQNYMLSDARDVYFVLIQVLLRQLPESENIFNIYTEKLHICNNVYDMNIYTKNFIKEIKKNLPINPDNHLNLLIDHAKKYIETNYSKNISRNDVSDYMFLSPSYFSRCFKKQTGVKFIDYLTNFRIEKSCELLLKGSANISTVCEAVGYNSPSYFTRVFKSVMGITPNEYIRANISQDPAFNPHI